ncbi:hypothetical protein ACFIJ5_10045 [Haloimpatiens sp. FM7330]|uniref:hypothetical protein n=1 Tax=Haloimpatiens sp. FM7330 TaxID=3298610 RepID=UPI00363E7688
MRNDLLKNFFKGSLSYVFLIILAIIVALSSIFTLSFVLAHLTRYTNYIFYLLPSTSFIIGVAVIMFWYTFSLDKIIFKIKKNDIQCRGIFKLFRLLHNSKFKKLIMFILVFLSLGGLFCTYSTFNVITEDSIIVHTPLDLNGRKYSYSDVAEIDTGISHDKDNNLYYKLKLKDSTIINVTSASMDSKFEKYELGIYYLDQKLLKAGAKKNIDTKFMYKFDNADFNKDYAKNVKKILQ